MKRADNNVFNTHQTNQTDHRITQLEEEIRMLKTQLEHAGQINETLAGMNDSAFRAIFNHSADGMMLIDSKELSGNGTEGSNVSWDWRRKRLPIKYRSGNCSN